MQNPKQLLQFIQSVAKKAHVEYDVHAQVEMACNQLNNILTSLEKKEEVKKDDKSNKPNK